MLLYSADTNVDPFHTPTSRYFAQGALHMLLYRCLVLVPEKPSKARISCVNFERLMYASDKLFKTCDHASSALESAMLIFTLHCRAVAYYLYKTDLLICSTRTCIYNFTFSLKTMHHRQWYARAPTSTLDALLKTPPRLTNWQQTCI